MWEYNHTNELYHYGVKGMKWGHRKARPIDPRAQNVRDARTSYAQARKDYRTSLRKARVGRDRFDNVYENSQRMDKAKQDYKQAKQDRYTPEERAARRQKAIKTGAAIAGTALAAYGAYKLNKYVKTKNCQIAAKRGYDAAEEMFTYNMREFSKTMNSHPNYPYKKGTVISANSGQKALDYANVAKTENFVDSARNVINYRRKNGKYSLKYLPSVGSYANNRGSYASYK